MPLMILTLWLSPSPGFSAVASVSPTSAPGVWSACAVTTAPPTSSVALPPAVDTVMRPAPTPAGTVSVTSCWSGVLPAPSTTVRRTKLPTVRPSMLMTRSEVVSPVPSSTRVLPTATVPPCARSTGTTCSSMLLPLPSTATAPLRASAGTATLSVVPPPPTLPVRVSVPVAPLSSSPWNCTSVLLVKPWPCSTMVCPVTAAGRPGSAATPALALATMAVNTLVGWVPKPAGICAWPPAVVMRIGPSRVLGATAVKVSLRAP